MIWLREVETIQRQIPMEGAGQRGADDTDALLKVDLIIKSSTFSRQDWVRMRVYAAFVRALHTLGLTRLPSMYLRFTHGVTYREFYDRLIEGHFASSPLFVALTAHFETFLSDRDAMEDLVFEPVADRRIALEAGRWLFASLSEDLDRVVTAMRSFLTAAYPDAPHLAGAVDYQRGIMLTPDYDPHLERSFGIDQDWPAYYARARVLSQYEPLGEPDGVEDGRIVVADPHAGAQRGYGSESDRWMTWLIRTRELQRTLSTTFPQIRLDRQSPTDAARSRKRSTA
jgi:hypothetical protein